jgi:hypothetical protein
MNTRDSIHPAERSSAASSDDELVWQGGRPVSFKAIFSYERLEMPQPPIPK